MAVFKICLKCGGKTLPSLVDGTCSVCGTPYRKKRARKKPVKKTRKR